MTAADTQVAVQNWFDLTRVELPLGWETMIDEYRTLKGSGKSRYEIMDYWTSKPSVLPPSKAQAAAMINAMERIEKGIPIQDPNERPSLEEAYTQGLGQLDIPWGKIALAAAAYFFVTQGLPNLLRKR